MPTREALDVLETPTGEFTLLPRAGQEDPFDLGLQTRTLASTAFVWSMTNDGCNPTCQSACPPSCTDAGTENDDD
ncbi:FxLD family lanthipeptide [Nocardiopsis sp. CA-288880]|uniref:FxLD family lanthipeptide n=1 Tax=Nocardiopsis sp. CA-288880 TaxID=3239995 RepID=UPI003D98EA8B